VSGRIWFRTAHLHSARLAFILFCLRMRCGGTNGAGRRGDRRARLRQNPSGSNENDYSPPLVTVALTFDLTSVTAEALNLFRPRERDLWLNQLKRLSSLIPKSGYCHFQSSINHGKQDPLKASSGCLETSDQGPVKGLPEPKRSSPVNAAPQGIPQPANKRRRPGAAEHGRTWTQRDGKTGS